MSSLHSLMFGWEYPPLHSGGLGVACQGLVRGLLAHRVGVTLVLPVRHDGDVDGVATRHPTGDIDSTRTVRSLLQPYDGFADYAERIRLAGSAMSDQLYGPDLWAAVDRYTAESVAITADLNPDVIHCHDWMTYEAGVRAAAHHDVPMIAHVHATEFDRTDFHPDPVIARIERRGLGLAHKIIAVSRYTKDLLVGRYGIDAGKISVVHNAHDHRPVAPQAVDPRFLKSRSPLVLFLGRMTVQKNPWQFLEVASRIHRVRPDVRFVMAGDGPMLGELMERSCALGLDQSLVFAGKVSKREAESLYAQAGCFVMPSLSEPFGLVALEAIGHGVPVVLSRQSGASEVIEHAFKVDFWDSDKMADCILTILREEPLAAQLRSEAPSILKRLSWKNQAGLVVSLYKNLINSFKS
jgi:glycogen synthase